MLAFGFRKCIARILLPYSTWCQEAAVKNVRNWSFFSNDALVLINVVEHPRSTLRNIANAVGLSDRATLSILRALEADAIIARRREGRRNVYTVDLAALRAHRGQGPYTLEELANALFVLSGRQPGRALPGPLRGAVRRSPPGIPRARSNKPSPARAPRRRPNPPGATGNGPKRSR
jgi:hypothetical protein